MTAKLNNLPEDYIDVEFCAYLEDQGFKIIEIIGDGNCLFRSIAYLISGDQDLHRRYRRLAVQYIRMNEYLFCGFLEETFDGNIVQYCNKMEKDGT